MSDATVGELRMFCGNYAPEDWVLCDGALLPIRQYGALFNLIGATFGGDGHTNFAVPDLRGRLPVGQGHGIQSSVTYQVGQRGGSEAVTLTPENTPVHTHAFSATAAAANTQSPVNAMLAAVTPNGNTKGLYAPESGAGIVRVQMDPNFLDYSYGSQTGTVAHQNMMPSLCVNFIICVNGNNPQRQ